MKPDAKVRQQRNENNFVLETAASQKHQRIEGLVGSFPKPEEFQRQDIRIAQRKRVHWMVFTHQSACNVKYQLGFYS